MISRGCQGELEAGAAPAGTGNPEKAEARVSQVRRQGCADGSPTTAPVVVWTRQSSCGRPEASDAGRGGQAVGKVSFLSCSKVKCKESLVEVLVDSP